MTAANLAAAICIVLAVTIATALAILAEPAVRQARSRRRQS